MTATGNARTDGPAKGGVEGGALAVDALRAAGVDTVFTLSGGHIFAFLRAADAAEMRIVDVRHEQTAAFAAEAHAKLTRNPAVALLTAGPGITNAVSAVATASANGSPLVVLGGRASQRRWGTGSLQEIDHVPLLAPITKSAATVTSTGAVAGMVRAAFAHAAEPHRGPVFLDVPIDVAHGRAEPGPVPTAPPAEAVPFDDAEVARAAQLVAMARRPVLVAGGDVWWGGAWEQLRRCVERLRVPALATGMGRGCLPAGHELALHRDRAALREADVVLVVGAPLDFRLSFGRFGDAEVVHVVDHPVQRTAPARAAVSPAGDLAGILAAFADWSGPVADHESWIAARRAADARIVRADEDLLAADTDPIHPVRVIGEVRAALDRDAIVIGDGGDFVSFAGRYLPSYQPGHWLDPGPYGCLGAGLGYAAAARLCHPDRQVVVLLGDGAFGFSATEVDTLVRHKLPVVMVMGNNGVWGLEKHPMRALYGSDVAADLQPGCRYDLLVEALGGAGELVERAADIAPALRRAFASGLPYLVNVLTDPAISYARTSRLG